MAYTILSNDPGRLLRLDQGLDFFRLQEFTARGLDEVHLTPAQLQELLRALPRERLWEALGEDVETPLAAPPRAWTHLRQRAMPSVGYCGRVGAPSMTDAPGCASCPACQGAFRQKEAAMLRQARANTLPVGEEVPHGAA